MTAPLIGKLRRRIAVAGPLTVAQYMQAALQDPEHGYYRQATPLGAAGDFVKAPEISQVFGELLGLWAAACWQQLGRPDPVRLIELGPGRGLLMADALRAARQVPEFLAALSVELVECHAGLRTEQQRRLAGLAPLAWHERLADIPPGPFILLANEFLDALPVRQFIRRADGWHERLVDADPRDAAALRFVEAPAPYAAAMMPPLAAPPENGEVIELAPERSALVQEIAGKAPDGRYAALIIDYGHDETRCGETLQALTRHQPAHPLAAPGRHDLTAHVDFGALVRALRQRADCGGPVAQGSFLVALGIEARTRQLIAAAATEADRQRIAAASQRLCDGSQMGRLFKTLGFTGPGRPSLPGLPSG